jgi:hypothetical protein
VSGLLALAVATYLFAAQRVIDDDIAWTIAMIALIAGVVLGAWTLAWPEARGYWKSRRKVARSRGNYAWVPVILITPAVAFGIFAFMTTDADRTTQHSSTRYRFLAPLMDISRSHELMSWVKMSIYAGAYCYFCAATVIYLGLAMTGGRR